MNQLDESLESAARALYEANANRVKPAWDDLGDACKSVWRGYVNRDPNWPFKYKIEKAAEIVAHHHDETPEATLHVSLHTSEPPEDLTTAVSGAGYARSAKEAPLQTWPTVTHEQKPPLTLAERLARKGIK